MLSLLFTEVPELDERAYKGCYWCTVTPSDPEAAALAELELVELAVLVPLRIF